MVQVLKTREQQECGDYVLNPGLSLEPALRSRPSQGPEGLTSDRIFSILFAESEILTVTSRSARSCSEIMVI